MGNQIKEKGFYPVPPQLLLANGNAFGLIRISKSSLFKVKQRVLVRAAAGEATEFEIKDIQGGTDIFVGPISGSIESRSDTSVYTTLSGAYIYAERQRRPIIAEQEIVRAAFEEEPMLAHRVALIDEDGFRIGGDNPLPIEGTITLGGLSSPVVVNIAAPTVQEYSYILPAGVKRFTIKSRNYSAIRVAWLPTETSTNYISYAPGCTIEEDGLKLLNATPIYIYITHASTTIEIMHWS